MAQNEFVVERVNLLNDEAVSLKVLEDALRQRIGWMDGIVTPFIRAISGESETSELEATKKRPA